MSDPVLQAGVSRLGTDDDVFTMILVLFTVYVGSCVAGWSIQTGDGRTETFTMILVLFTVYVGSCVAGWSSQIGEGRRRVHDDPDVVHGLCRILCCRLEYPRLGTDDDVFTMILVLFTVYVGSCVAG